MSQERIQKKTTSTKTEEAPQEEVKKTDTKEALKDELDDLLADIDEALGENLEVAAQFVASFLQKGGQ